MEPRPSRPTRATGQSSTRPTRTPWTPSPTVEPPASPRTADIYNAPPGQGGQWYGQPGIYAPDPDEYRQTSPLTPIKPRNERGGRLLRYLLAAILLIAVVGGGAYGITRLLANDDDGEPNGQIAMMPLTSATPEATATPDTIAQQSEATATTAPQPTDIATPQPTQSPAASDDATSSNAQNIAATSTPETVSSGSVASFLPAASALDGDWEITDEGTRDKAQVAAAIGANGNVLLTNWRWRENSYRDLTRVDPNSYPNETAYINVSVHRFANAEGASEALDALADIVVQAQGLQDVETPVMGDRARGLFGPGDGVNLYVLYMQDGKYLIRIGGSSVTGDPSGTVNALAQTILADQETS